MTETMTVKTAKGQTIGVGVGNAAAYMLLEFMSWKYDWTPDDPAVIVVMAGTLLGVLALQFRHLGAGLKYVFDRVFPAKSKGENE